MLDKTNAIVLNKIKYSDSSIIVNLLTKKYGKISLMAKSCRKRNSSVKANIFIPLNIIEVDFYYKQKRSIQLLKNVSSIYNISNISTNIYKTCIAQFIAEIIHKSIKEEISLPDVYNFIENSVVLLNQTEKTTNLFHIVFCINLLKKIGFEIHNNYCIQTPYFNIREAMFLPVYTNEEEALDSIESFYLSQIISSDIDNTASIKIPYKFRLIILDNLIKYFKYHVLNNQEIKSVQVLNSVFEI